MTGARLLDVATWRIVCGGCGLLVAAEAVYGSPVVGTGPLDNNSAAMNSTLWLQCPNCGEGSVKLRTGAVYPAAPVGAPLKGLPTEVDGAWREAGTAFSVSAYTACEMMCRKLLMHVAVDKAGSKPGKHFVEYVNDLESAGLIISRLKPLLDRVKDRGNEANHQIPSSSEKDSRWTLTVTRYLLEGVYQLPSDYPISEEASPE